MELMGKFSNSDIGMPVKDTKKSGSKVKVGRRREGWKDLQTAGKTYAESKKKETPYGRSGGNSREKKQKGAFYRYNTPLGKFEKNLDHYGAVVKVIEGDHTVVPREGGSIGISVGKDGDRKDFVGAKDIKKIAREFHNGFKVGKYRLPPGVSESEVKSSEQIFKFLAGKDVAERTRGKELGATVVLAGLFIFSIIGLLLIMQKTSPTGFVVGELADSSINTGVFLCILGIIGLLIYRFKFGD